MKLHLRTVMTALLMTLIAASIATAQRPRSISDPADPTTSSQSTAPAPPPAPATVKAKYEGGVIGYKKSDGTITFDDANSRLVFRDQKQKEVFAIPYQVVMLAYADTQARRPTAATVAGSLPLPYGANLAALFIKKKYRYLVLSYSDPDTSAQGTANFKLANKELLASVLTTLARKAELTQRGEAYVRRRASATTSDATLQTKLPVPPDNR